MSIKVDGTDALNKSLSAYAKKIKKAEKRAVRKTTDYAHSAIASGIAKKVSIPVGTVKNRIKKYMNSTGLKGKVFAGTKDLPVRYLIKNEFELIQQLINRPKIGVKAGKKRYAGSFVMLIGSGSRAGVFERVGKNRLPVKEVKLTIRDASIESFNQIKPQIADQLIKKFNQELNYAMKVEK